MSGHEKPGPDFAPASSLPLQREELAALFAPLEDYDHLVLAVSGGSDSIALMHLASLWRAAVARVPKIEVVTVDHGLRPESAREALWVGEEARALGFPHTTLVWSGPKPASGIQEAARQARYDLLLAHARAGAGEGTAAIVTAHTEDDQAETLLMRLARGSGLDGLSAMPLRRELTTDGAVVLVRPLLGCAKARLVATLEADGKGWIEDPSNECRDFERVRLRGARNELAALGLTTDKLALSARRLTRAREAVEGATRAFCEAHVDVNHGVYAEIGRGTLTDVLAEVRLRVLGRVLAAFGGEAKLARLSRIEALAEDLASGQPLARTLGGCMISAGRKTVRIFREPDRNPLPDIMLEAGAEALWDKRFHIRIAGPRVLAAAGIATPIRIAPLGIGTYATLRGARERNRLPPARAAASMPSFWSQDRLIRVGEPMSGAALLPQPSDAAGDTLFSVEPGEALRRLQGLGIGAPRHLETKT